MKNVIEERLRRLREVMRREHLAAFVFPGTDPHGSEYVPSRWEGRKWVSGFDGSAGLAVVTTDAAALWTDSRYFIAAAEQLRGTEFVLMKERVEGTPDPAEWIASRLSGATSTEVGIDGMSSSAATVEALIADLRKAGGITVRTNLDVLEEIWDELIRIRNQMGRNLGYENYIPVGYLEQGRTDYGEKEVASFREQVRTFLVPLCQKLYDAQAKRLGIDHVMWYDEKMVFPDGNAEPAGDDAFMVRTAQKMYHEISPETGEFIDFMIDHELMDLQNKPGKASTGYMTSLPSLKAPFVFSCFNHTIFDMQVLTHELGHAFAGYMAMRSQPIADFYSESTDIAEIHSMSMEQFAYPYAEWFFGDQADKFRFAHLQEALTFVPFGVAVDEFQHICYAHPEMTPKERTYQWHLLEEKYMPWRRYEDDAFMERGGYWYHKLHIYLYPFYYINYTLTTMGAMEFKKKYAENRDAAWQDYLKLCKTGGSRSYLETLRYANLANPFEPGSVERACGYAEEILLKQIAEQAK